MLSQAPSCRQHQQCSEHHLHFQDRLDVRLLSHRLDVSRHKRADHADHNAGRGDCDWEQQGVPPSPRQELVDVRPWRHGGRDDQRSARTFREAAEEIGAHASDVAHIVADIVSNSSGIAGIILLQTCYNFAYQVSAYIGGFRVDATAHTTEHGNRAAAQAVASHAIHHSLHVHFEVFVDAQKHPQNKDAERAEKISHDSAASECNIEGLGVAIFCSDRGECGPSIRKCGNHHAQVAAEHGCRCSYPESNCCEGTLAEGGPPPHENPNDDAEEDTKSSANPILFSKEGFRPFHDSVVNADQFLLRAAWGLQTVLTQHAVVKANSLDQHVLNASKGHSDYAAHYDEAIDIAVLHCRSHHM
mmetsp:Transcript_48030/g.102938  ORF Transcript_48030/g.102938 Transcript_48030/m.102938 type:complete len:358 (+) Transcript_48030:1290-2363(+)